MRRKRVRFEPLETRRLLTDVSLAYVDEGAEFEQTGPSTVVPASGQYSPYYFNANVSIASGGSVNSASEESEVSDQSNALTENSSDTQFNFSEGFASESALTSAFPDGTYDLNIDAAHDGNNTLVIGVNGDDYPNAPEITNYDSLQNLDSSQAQVITWNSFVGGAVNDTIFVVITDQNDNKVFETRETPGASGALDGLATSVTVPGGTLEPGQTYTLAVLFNLGVSEDTTDYPGVIGYGVYTSETALDISTSDATFNNGELTITGTSSGDSISVSDVSGDVTATIDGASQGPYTGVSSISVTSAGGNATVTLASVPIPATVLATNGYDTITGSDGGDSIRAHGINNFITGGAGNDTLVGPGGSDTIFASGSGNDFLKAKNTGNKLRGGTGGNDTLVGGSGEDTLKGHGGNNSILAGSGNELIHGFGGNNTIVGGSGSDTITGNHGNNTITAGSGGGEIVAGFDNDSITGSTTSGYLADSIYCGSGFDTIVAGTGDSIYDSTANDSITGGTIV